MSNKDNLIVLKVVLAGDGTVGKTSLVRRYASGKFDQSRVMTIGVDFQTKIVKVGTREIKLSIWDVAGQERFGSFRQNFYKGARAVALVYDITNPESLDNLKMWQKEVAGIVPKTKFIVVGNKNDLPNMIKDEQGEKWAKTHKAPHILTSAKDGKGVDKFFDGLGWLALTNAEDAKK